ncbi:type II toxin-antitoxin system VapC family toxin [Sphingomonas sp. GB1N7]|uniref:type II toxin-antitoxin system VapC family toxin n=1 Tax=Parasphingomonas caseinilytica TaxID=3096158 RepID=UPI002FC613C6
MTGIVLDASVAVKLVSREAGSEAALSRVAEATEIIAPDWMALETAHALWKKVKAGELDRKAADAGVEALAKILDRTYPASLLMSAALVLSYDLRHPIYDCLYLALAQVEQVRVLTADGKFAENARQGGFADHVELMEGEGS